MSVRYPKPQVLTELAGARHAVIEASAGTGKTFTIEHALLDRLLAGLPLEQLLVVTFTEKAATDLRRRIRELIERALGALRAGEGPPLPPGAPAWTLGEGEGELLEAALRAFSQAPIFTIHGFCQRVLAEHAFPCGRLFEQELVDGREAFAEGFLEVLRERLAAPHDPQRPELRAWLASGRDVESLAELLRGVAAADAELRPRFAPAELEAAAATLSGLLRGAAGETLRADLQTAKLGRGDVRSAVGRCLDAWEEALARWDQRGAALELALALEEGRQRLGYLLDPKRRAKLVKGLPALGAVIEAARGLRRACVSLPAAAAHLFLDPVRARARERKRARGLFDFDDMLGLVRDALVDPEQGPLLLRALRSRYRLALIDEFQDTDPVQWEVFRRLFVEGTCAHGLWVIGDPKQAIYGFRGADVFTYLRAREVLVEAQGAARVPLTENFRSTPRLIAAYNHLFDPKLEPPFFHGAIRYEDPVSPGRPLPEPLDPAELAPIHLVHFERDEAPWLRASEVRDLLARRYAREIRRLVAEDEVRVCDGEGGRRALEWKDVYVLTYARWEGELLAGYLREEGVPFAFYKQDGLFQTDEAGHVADLLAAVADPRDRAKRLAAWRTPFFGLSREELAACQDLDGDHPLLRRLGEWHALAERGDYEALFRRIVGESGLVRRELFLEDDERALTNVLHLLELLLEESGRARRTLRELVLVLRSWIDQSRAPGGETGNVQRLETEDDAVQVLTMHKSKGLEAQVVFLFGGLSERLDKGQVNTYHEPGEEESPQEPTQLTVLHTPEGRRVVHVGPLDGFARERVAQEQREERQRLLYVAITRAKSRLYLPSFGKHVKRRRSGEVVLDREGEPALEWDFPRLGGVYREICERLYQVIQGSSGALPNERFSVEAARELRPRRVAAAALAACRDWRPDPELLTAQAPAEDALRALRDARAGRALVSYSGLKALEQALGTAKPFPAPPPPDPGALRGGTTTGSFLHVALELLPFESLAARPSLEEWRALPAVAGALRRAGYRHAIPDDQVPLAERLLYRALRAPLDLPGASLAEGIWRAEGVLKELEFSYPIPEGEAPRLLGQPGGRLEVGRGYVRGAIDLVFRAGGRAFALDWKGDRLAGYAQPDLDERVAALYDRQRDLYHLALVKLLQVRDEADYEARCGGTVYAFLRGMAPDAPEPRGLLVFRPSWSEVERLLLDLRDDSTLEVVCPRSL